RHAGRRGDRGCGDRRPDGGRRVRPRGGTADRAPAGGRGAGAAADPRETAGGARVRRIFRRRGADRPDDRVGTVHADAPRPRRGARQGLRSAAHLYAGHSAARGRDGTRAAGTWRTGGDAGGDGGGSRAPRAPAHFPGGGTATKGGTRRPSLTSALDLAGDELLDQVAADVVAVLLRRRLHEVARHGDDRSADAAVEGDLRRAHRVDDHARRVGGVPDLELVLQVQRHVAEGLALEADVGELAVIEPRHVVGGADVHGRALHLVRDLRRDGLGLGDLLRLEAGALQHVHEVHVAAEVELVRAQQLDTAVFEQLGQ